MARNRQAEALDRITQPMVRENGALRAATWDEAMERAAGGIQRTLAARGPDAVGFFSCSKATNEVNFVAQKFMRVAVGSNNVDSCNRT